MHAGSTAGRRPALAGTRHASARERVACSVASRAPEDTFTAAPADSESVQPRRWGCRLAGQSRPYRSRNRPGCRSRRGRRGCVVASPAGGAQPLGLVFVTSRLTGSRQTPIPAALPLDRLPQSALAERSSWCPVEPRDPVPYRASALPNGSCHPAFHRTGADASPRSAKRGLAARADTAAAEIAMRPHQQQGDRRRQHGQEKRAKRVELCDKDHAVSTSRQPGRIEGLLGCFVNVAKRHPTRGRNALTGLELGCKTGGAVAEPSHFAFKPFPTVSRRNETASPAHGDRPIHRRTPNVVVSRKRMLSMASMSSARQRIETVTPGRFFFIWIAVV